MRFKFFACVALFALPVLAGCFAPRDDRAPPTATGPAAPADLLSGHPAPVAVPPADFDLSIVRGRVGQPRARYAAIDKGGDTAAIRRMDEVRPAGLRARGMGIAADAVGRTDRLPTPPDGGSRVVDSTEITSFDSVNFDTNGITTGRLFVPSDAMVAAGHEFVVGVTNTTMVIHDKAGTLHAQVGLNSFFAGLSPQTFTFDPKVIYDQHADRFVLTTLELTDVALGNAANTSRLFFAVSDDDDPRGEWLIGEIDTSLVFFNTRLGTTVAHWADFPGLAVDAEAIYITANMFAFFSTGGGTQGGVRIWILDKGLGTGGLYDGGAFSANVYDPYASNGIHATTQPAHVFGNAPSPIGTWLVSYEGLSGGGTEFVQVIRVDDPLATPLFTHQFVTLGDIEDFATSLPDAPQLGSTLEIHTNNRRALNAVWRDDSLWMTFTMVEPVSLEAQAYWLRMDTSGPGTIEMTAEQGGVAGDDIAPGTHTFFPWLAVNDRNQMTIGFSASAASIYAGAYYAVRTPEDPPGTVGPSRVLREGVDFYDRPDAAEQNRWGDYSGVAIDPLDQCFWLYNQYAMERGTPLGGRQGRWATAFGKICVFDCGNGNVEPGEECDDANTSDEDACRNTCKVPACGDGIVDEDLGEVCDDGNDINTDGCLNDCTVNDCGPLDTDDDGVNDLCDLDDDGDGSPDTEDCAPLDAGAFEVPADVAALTVTPSASTIVSWNNLGQGVVYDLATGTLADLRADGGPAISVCLADDRSSSIAIDSRPAPLPGEGVWYLVRADNGCLGSYGAASSGDERLPHSCP